MYDINTKTLTDRRELLRIKAITLMVEAKLIRREEAKQKAFARKASIPDPILQREMQLHRTGILRAHARTTHVARGLIKGLALPQIEQYPKNLLTNTDWIDIGKMVKSYGSPAAVAFYEEQRKLCQGKVYAVAPPFVKKERPKVERKAVTA